MSTTALAINIAASAICVLADGFFISMHLIEKRKEKKSDNFILRNVLNLTWANFLRAVFLIIMAPIPNTPVYCHVISIPFNTFRLGECFFSSVLAYSLMYRLRDTNINSKHTAGETFIQYLSWILSILLALIGSVVPYEGNAPAAKALCVFDLQGVLLQIFYWTSFAFNSIVLLYFIYYAYRYGKIADGISYGFYFAIFFSFEFLRMPFFIFDLITIVTGNRNFINNNINLFFIFGFISLACGAVTSILFSYNLGYLTNAYQYLQNCRKKKENSRKDSETTSV